ncbi:hypothetical protein [Rhodococcus rhodnii]|uniref:Uncharacterized protein n=1 Tax=Rhodococcus rhodnii LMG 5362 TaxID=1273125 RepID=R7WUT1_9NOCA|nr:hypothetical protein [Rhodococcus rhodnii]EOM77889.1 hypothetical protein Rrhod_0782 [Rhodococcus rhodnii LMG 5362]
MEIVLIVVVVAVLVGLVLYRRRSTGSDPTEPPVDPEKYRNPDD